MGKKRRDTQLFKIFFFFFLGQSFNLWRLLLMIALYHQTKIPISFWCKRGLNFAHFAQKIQHFAQFSKLIREMPLFWNLIFSKSSFNVTIGSLKRYYRYWAIKKKKKKTCMELEFQNATIGSIKRHYRAP